MSSTDSQEIRIGGFTDEHTHCRLELMGSSHEFPPGTYVKTFYLKVFPPEGGMDAFIQRLTFLNAAEQAKSELQIRQNGFDICFLSDSLRPILIPRRLEQLKTSEFLGSVAVARITEILGTISMDLDTPLQGSIAR